VTSDFGGEIKYPTGEWAQAPTVTRHPVTSEEDVEKLTLPDVRSVRSLHMMMEFCKISEKFGSFIIPHIGAPLSEVVAGLCGTDLSFRWMIRRPELLHRLLRLVTDFSIEVAKHWVNTFGAERLMVFETAPIESNQLISPKQFKEFAFPYLKELHEQILAMGIKHIYCHICGEQNLNLPYWAQIPMGNPGIVSIGQEVDLATAIKYFGDSCVIAGNVEPAVIQEGTPQQIYELTKQCIEKAKHAPRGYLLMPGCELPPKAAPYKVYMMKKAVMDFGWYD
jgi:uroporphyrinogen decarboxylase